MIIYSVIFVLIGAFSLTAGVFNWDWFMNNRRARFFVKVFTRTGARIFYGLIGAGCIVLGILILTGKIDVS